MTFERVRPEGASPEAGARHTWSPPSADISKGPVPIPMPYYKLSAHRKHLRGVQGAALRAAAPGKLPERAVHRANVPMNSVFARTAARCGGNEIACSARHQHGRPGLTAVRGASDDLVLTGGYASELEAS